MAVHDFSNDIFEILRPMDLGTQNAVLKADPCVVGILSHNVPDEMIHDPIFCSEPKSLDEENVFWGNGTIIECEDGGGGEYFGTILASAALFFRVNDIPLNKIEVDVYLSNGKLCKGEVFACDFHYNLAAIRIRSNFPLQTAKLRGLDDILSIDPTEQFRLFSEQSFQLRRDSNLFKILPGTKIISPRRFFYSRPSRLRVATACFCEQNVFSTYDCKELYWIKGDGPEVDNGGPITNDCGEVIGIALCSFSFLPSNIVSRWWNHYKRRGEFCRPQLGVAIANLYSARLEFLEQFMKRFPDITAGVVVTKVEEDTLGCHSGIQRKDVIIKCDGLLVRSKLEFFEIMWDKAGKTVELIVLRVSNGDQLTLSLSIGETTPDKFYRWQFPSGFRKKRNI